MSNGKPENLRVRIEALQLDAEGLLKLLGSGDPRFWEILKGITTPAVFSVVEAAVDVADLQVKAAIQTVKALEANAKGLSSS